MISQQIANLVRLALGTDNASEASAAALRACKALVACGAVPKDSQRETDDSRASAESRDRSSGLQTRIDTLEREKRTLLSQVTSLQGQLDELKNPPRCIQAKFESRCKGCGEPIEIGESCWWTKGKPGANCMACGHA